MSAVGLAAALLPGAGAFALYLLLAGALLALCYRFLRRFSLAAAVALVVLPLAFPGPALLSGRIYAPLDLHYRSMPLKALRQELEVGEERSVARFDVAFEMIPARKATRYAIKNGQWPLLNPFILSGDILAAAAQPAAFHPVNLLSYLLPLGPSLTFVAAATLLLTILCAFFFLREIGCREVTAVLGGAAWTFSGFQIWWIGWPHALTFAVFPLLLLAVRRVVRSPGIGSATLLTVTFVLMLLAGHPESVFHCVVVGAMYGLWELVIVRPERPVAVVSAAVGAGCAALLLSAVYLLPFLEAVPQTAQYKMRRSMTTEYGRHSVDWATAAQRIASAPVSFAFGEPRDEASRSVRTTDPRWYVGSAMWALAFFGLSRGRWRGRWLFAVLAVLGFLLYVDTPVVTDLLAQVPLFDLAVNHRLVFLTAFAISVLAALGAEAWAENPREHQVSWIAVATLGALGLGIVLFLGRLRAAGFTDGDIAWHSLLECAPVAVVAALLWRARSVRLVLVLLVALLTAQRVLEASTVNRSFEPRHLAPTVREIAVLPHDSALYRVTGVGSSLAPNVAALYELEDARGVSAMTNALYFQTYKLWARHLPGAPHIARIDDLSRPFLSFLNVRFAIADSRMPRGGWSVVALGDGFSVLENPNVLDRAFVPTRIRFVPPGLRVVQEMKRETDFSRRAWIEDDVGEAREVENGRGHVTVRRDGVDFHLEVEMEQEGWVVVSQTFWKGWRARVAGRELELRPANHAFLGFHLPAGRHQVELVYRPASFVLGLWVSGMTAVAAAAFLVGASRRRGGAG